MQSQLLNHTTTRTVDLYSHALADEVYEARLQQRAGLEKDLEGNP